MNNKLKYVYIFLIFSGFFLSSKCKKDDEPSLTPPRDRKEQYFENEKDSILHFLQTHTYTIDAENNFRFDTLTDPATQTALIDVVDMVQIPDTIAEDEFMYDLYYLHIAPGTTDSITTCDRVLVGAQVYGFDNTPYIIKDKWYPVWTSVFKPIVAGLPLHFLHDFLPQYKAGTYTEVGDGSVEFSDYGNFVVFVPSGLAQFNRAITVDQNRYIPSYTPLVVQIKTFYVNTDLDGDHVPNVVEDLNGDGDPTNDNTDDPDHKDPANLPNYLDPDDDGDHLRTKDEDPNGNGDPTDDDTDGDGIPNYLDKDTH